MESRHTMYLHLNYRTYKRYLFFIHSSFHPVFRCLFDSDVDYCRCRKFATSLKGQKMFSDVIKKEQNRFQLFPEYLCKNRIFFLITALCKLFFFVWVQF